MIRKIVSINEQLCNGCGLCASACHEGAIAMVNGKAKLIRDDYCDGLGDCLPACPTGAISIIEREAAAYDEQAVLARQAETASTGQKPHGCPGSMARALHPQPAANVSTAVPQSQLSQWPVQIKLAPVNAPYFDGANLLVAADCSAYAYGDFHNKFIRNRVTLIGCPKLDEGDYSEKLTAIIKANDIKSLTIVRMEVPCCGGIEFAAKKALQESGKFIPWQVVTVTTDGKLLD